MTLHIEVEYKCYMPYCNVISVPIYIDLCCASGMAALWLSALCRNKIPSKIYELCPKLHIRPCVRSSCISQLRAFHYVQTVSSLCLQRRPPARSQLRDLELIITKQCEGQNVANLQFIGGTEPRPAQSEAADRLLAKRSR